MLWNYEISKLKALVRKELGAGMNTHNEHVRLSVLSCLETGAKMMWRNQWPILCVEVTLEKYMSLRVNESFKVPAFFFWRTTCHYIQEDKKGLATDTKANKLKQQKQKQKYQSQTKSNKNENTRHQTKHTLIQTLTRTLNAKWSHMLWNSLQKDNAVGEVTLCECVFLDNGKPLCRHMCWLSCIGYE
jgi:hypothetical protein